MIRRPPRSTQSRSSAASDVYKRQLILPREGTHATVGGPGEDTISYANIGANHPVLLDLLAGTVTQDSGPQTVTEVEHAIGSPSGDQLFGTLGRNVLSGGAGGDELGGRAGPDDLHGGAGADTLNGGLGDDSLFGDEDNDMLFGEEDDDRLRGGSGIDMLNGGAGSDDFDGDEPGVSGGPGGSDPDSCDYSASEDAGAGDCNE